MNRIKQTKKIMGISVVEGKRGRGRPPGPTPPLSNAEKHRRRREKIAAIASEKVAAWKEASAALDVLLSALPSSSAERAGELKSTMEEAFATVLERLSVRNTIEILDVHDDQAEE